jgi:hypothetical protein
MKKERVRLRERDSEERIYERKGKEGRSISICLRFLKKKSIF